MFRGLVVPVLGVAFVVGGVELCGAWLDWRFRAKKTEQAIALSEQETERLKIIIEAVAPHQNHP